MFDAGGEVDQHQVERPKPRAAEQTAHRRQITEFAWAGAVLRDCTALVQFAETYRWLSVGQNLAADNSQPEWTCGRFYFIGDESSPPESYAEHRRDAGRIQISINDSDFAPGQ